MEQAMRWRTKAAISCITAAVVLITITLTVNKHKQLEPQDVITDTTISEVATSETTVEEQISTTQESTTQAETTTMTTTTKPETTTKKQVQKKVESTTKATTTTKPVQHETPKGEYAYARQVWNRLKAAGFNDHVSAGIIGNMMAEVGGQTLNLRPFIYGHGGGYYGLCQWSLQYAPSVKGASVDGQIDYLLSSLPGQMNTYGKRFRSGFNYNEFTQLTDHKAAALAFAKCYERCGSKYYAVRQKNAEIAYNYFVK